MTGPWSEPLTVYHFCPTHGPFALPFPASQCPACSGGYVTVLGHAASTRHGPRDTSDTAGTAGKKAPEKGHPEA